MSSSSSNATCAYAISAAINLLMTPPSTATLQEVTQIAQRFFDPSAVCKVLTGERDQNFLVTRGSREQNTLKLINCAETVDETQMQIRVLEHLAGRCAVAVPEHVMPLGNHPAGFVCVKLDNQEAEVRVRAYSFLNGCPLGDTPPSAQLRVDIGRRLAELDSALQGFTHPAVTRVFLWDLMQLPALGALIDAVAESELCGFIAEFLEVFERSISPVLETLRHQVIHNDLSGSNLLVNDDASAVVGILDFGDMVYAPLVCDLAITASYLITDTSDPLGALQAVCDGYEQVMPLHSAEREVLLDLVIARLVQRIVITQWRAAQFPENSLYILRSSPAAVTLMHKLIEPWRASIGRRFPATTLSNEPD